MEQASPGRTSFVARLKGGEGFVELVSGVSVPFDARVTCQHELAIDATRPRVVLELGKGLEEGKRCG